MSGVTRVAQRVKEAAGTRIRAGYSQDIDKKDKSLAQHQLRAVLQRLCQVHGLDLLTPRQIRNCARQFQDAMIGPRR